MPTSTIDAMGEQVDHRHLARASFFWIALLALILAMDGFDLLVMGFSAPSISHEFMLSRFGIGWFLTLSHGAVALGGIGGGTIGDRYGRIAALRLSVGIFALFTLCGAITRDFTVFACCRCIASLGLGAATPNIAAYLLEIIPNRWRSTLTTSSFATMVLGSVICGIVAKQFMPIYGWRMLFQVGGVSPLLLWPLLWFVPESPAYLVAAGVNPVAVGATIKRLYGNQHSVSGTEAAAIRAADTSVRSTTIFAPAYRRDTVALWALTFTVMFTAVAITSMGAVVITSTGNALSVAISALLAFNIAGLLGAITAGILIGQLGSRRALGLLLPVCTVSLLGLGYTLSRPTPASYVIAAMAVCGFGLTSQLIALYPLSAHAYPIHMRSTGAGAALGIGRVGSTLSAVVVAALLAHGSAPMVMSALAAVTVGAAVALHMLRRQIPPTPSY